VWLKLEALARHELGQVERANELFARYRCDLQAQPDPSAETLDEIACMALMEKNFPAAAEFALKAIAKGQITFVFRFLQKLGPRNRRLQASLRSGMLHGTRLDNLIYLGLVACVPSRKPWPPTS
jgi:hypothetical protein